MHKTAMAHGKCFFDTYHINGVVIDIGAQDVNGSLKEISPTNIKYIGVDFIKGKGVDVVLNDPYKLPFDNDSIDCIVCNSCFEHSEFFWITFLEILRVLKPSGLLYLNAPSNGCFHQYPLDCWRFYPDSGKALSNWANYSGYKNTALLESFIGQKDPVGFSDFVAVFIKDKSFVENFPERMIDKLNNFENGYVFGSNEIKNHQLLMEETRQLLREREKRKQKKGLFRKIFG